MKFTKQALLTASFVFGAAVFALGARETETLASGEITLNDSSGSVNKNYLIEQGANVVFNVEKSATLQGNLYGAGQQDAATHLLMNTYKPLEGTTITITGGGILEYKGFKDIKYYDGKTYQYVTNSPEPVYSNAFPSSLLAPDKTTGAVDTSKTAYSGSMVVSGGTTLKVSGYLTQYVSPYYGVDSVGKWVGVQDITLKDNSTISFVSSQKNLLDVFGDANNINKTNSLNFLKNVTASAESTIELGNDRNYVRADGTRGYSTTRLVIQTDSGKTSKIGHLKGTGRVYFTGTDRRVTVGDESNVYFTSKADFATNIVPTGTTNGYVGSERGPNTFDAQDWLNYVHSIANNYDTTGETVGGALADVFLGDGKYHLGSDGNGNIVNNIFASATALQLGFRADTTYNRVLTLNRTPGDISTLYSTLNPDYVPSQTQNNTQTTLVVYGTQIVNNFQSMILGGSWDEGDNKIWHADRWGMEENVVEGNKYQGFSEPFYGYKFGNYKVELDSDAVLVINQDELHDGIFLGKFLGNAATNDGVVVKTGKGNFANVSDESYEAGEQAIERLMVLEGMWITNSTALSTTSVTIGADGKFMILCNTTGQLRGTVKATRGAELHIARDTLYTGINEEGTTIQKSYLETGYVDSNGKKNISAYLLKEVGGGYGSFGNNEFAQKYLTSIRNGIVEVVKSQDEFYGSVFVDRGMTLVFGSSESENYSNAFVNADKIVLCGEDDVFGLDSKSKIIIGSVAGTGGYDPSYVQVLSLYYKTKDANGNDVIKAGVGEYNSVTVNENATLAWNIKSGETADFEGVSMGTGGALVKLNGGTLNLKKAIGYTGATGVLNGTLNLSAANAINSSAGLILAGNAYLQNDSRKDQLLRALVGGKNTAVGMNGAALTIGSGNVDTSTTAPIANYFFATYNGASKYFGTESGSLNLLTNAGISEEKKTELFGSLGTQRPQFNGHTITVEDTVNYIKDPALLSDTFARAHAVIDVGTWDNIKRSFGTEKDLLSFFKETFSIEKITDFKNASHESDGWTARQCEVLLEFAKQLNTNDEYIFEREGNTGRNLTMADFAVLKDTYALKYLAEKVLNDATVADLSLYNFIRKYDSNYSFRFTTTNIAMLAMQYGIAVGGNSDEERQQQFNAAIGVATDLTVDYGPAFAGTIEGRGTNLTKTGTETLTLTGKNTYSGSTHVENGELRVDHDAIQFTTGIRVDKGALLTIVSGTTDNDGNTIEVAKFEPALLCGAGTLLKDGAGTLEIVNALAEKVEDAKNDFTGSIIVGKDTLQVDIRSREELKSDIYVNKNATFKILLEKENAADEFILSGGIYGEGKFEFAGTGKFVFTDGDAIADDENSNVTFSSGEKTSFKFILDGVIGASSLGNTNSDFRDSAAFVIGSDATLEFNIASKQALNNSALTYAYSGTINAGAADKTGELIVTGSGDGDLGSGRTLQLTGTDIHLDKITLADMGVLQITGKTEANSVAVGNETSTAKLDVSGRLNASSITIGAGSQFVNTGTITTGTLEINSETTQTAGTITVSDKLTVNANTSLMGTLDLAGAQVFVADSQTLTINKTVTKNETTAFTLGNASMLKVSGTSDIDILGNLTPSSANSTLVVDQGSLIYNPNSSFTGRIELANSASLKVNMANTTAITAVSGSGTVEVVNTDCNVNLTVSVDADSTFTGTFKFTTDPDIVLAGTGVWNVYESGTWAKFENVAKIQVANGAGIGVGATGTVGAVSGTVPTIALGDGAVIALNDTLTTGTPIQQQFDVKGTVQNLTLRANGSFDLLNAPETIFGLDAGRYNITFSNFNGDLTVTNLGEIGEKVSLATYGENGVLTLEGTASGSAAEYNRSIGGNGNLAISENVILGATSHTYTGTTTVNAGATATFNNATLASSKLTVAGTLKGGVTLANTAAIVFKPNSKYLASIDDGNKLVAGTISGTVDVTLSADNAKRGSGYALFVGNLDGLHIAGAQTTGARPLMVENSGNQLIVYVAQNNLRDVEGVSYHDGIGSFLDILSDFARPDAHGVVADTIGHALNRFSTDELSSAVEKLSPLSYASMVSMPAGSFSADQNSINQRLKQRLYDNTSPSAVWDYAPDWEFFAQAQGTSANAGTRASSMTYDYNTFGVFAGVDRKFSQTFTAGFAIGYDRGNANIHHSGGKIEGSQVRLAGFAGSMINDYIALNVGAELGFSDFDIKRENGFGKSSDSTNGINGGVFADALMAFPLHEFTDGERLDLMPHIGLALGYYNVDSSNENGALGALNIDRFDALSLQGKVGAELVASFSVLEYKTRATFDVSLIHEFLDDEVEIDASIAGKKFKTDAKAMSKTALSISPGVSVDLDAKTSVYLNYEFRAGTESIMTHNVNVGFRHRF